MHVSTAPPVAAASLATAQHKIHKQYLCLGNAEADFWGLKCNQLQYNLYRVCMHTCTRVWYREGATSQGR